MHSAFYGKNITTIKNMFFLPIKNSLRKLGGYEGQIKIADDIDDSPETKAKIGDS